LDVETHREVFGWVLECLSCAGLVRGKTIGIDATTLEANAAMRSIRRRDTGGMRRTHLRGHENILKRLLVHGGGFNLGLRMRSLFGIGKPRRLQGRLSVLRDLLSRLVAAIHAQPASWIDRARSEPDSGHACAGQQVGHATINKTTSTTGC
jgi:hypothetical protein